MIAPTPEEKISAEEAAELKRRVLEMEDFTRRIQNDAANTIAIAEELAIAKELAEGASQQAADHAARTHAVLNAVSDAILTVEPDGSIDGINASATAMLGFERADLAGTNLGSLITEIDLIHGGRKIEPALFQLLADGDHVECTGIRKDGKHFPIELSVSQMTISGATKYTCVIRDITERKKADAAIRQAALFDPLTKLANRSEFQRQLASAIQHSDREGKEVALLLLDLDKFKDVNDSYGHPTGDALLIYFAECLNKCVRETDTVARIGGDEFAIIATNFDHSSQIAILAERILGMMSEPATLDGSLINVGTSIGICRYPKDAADADELIRLCDNALYEAKKRGRGVYQFFDGVLDAKAREALILENDLRLAIVRQEFTNFYQPQISTKTGDIVGAEALVRWNHPTKGLVFPDKFIVPAEEKGLIADIGKLVLEAACRDAKAWQDQGFGEFKISVNVSPLQFNDADFVQSISHALAETGLDPRWLVLEITEHAMISDTEETTVKLNQITSLGAQVAVDDFGTGYSSLMYLKQFPISTLKIDKIFVDELAHSSHDAAVAKAILELGRCFDMNAVAEGVETSEQIDALAELECEAIQGYFYSRPLPEQDFRDWLKDR